MNSRWLRAVAAIGLGGGIALAGPALPAVGTHSHPSVATDIEVGRSRALGQGRRRGRSRGGHV